MQMRLYLQVTSLRGMKLLASQLVSYQDFKTVFDEVHTLLGKSWGLSKDQRTHLRSHAAALGFQEVFGNPHQEGILMAACKEVSSNVHNQYGKNCCVIDGDKHSALEQATFQMATQFKTGGPRTSLPIEYQIRVALHHQWAFENVWQMSEEMKMWARRHSRAQYDDDTEPSYPEDLQIINGPDGPVCKCKRLTPKVGKVCKGKDNWSCIDKWWVWALKCWGSNLMQSELWRGYIVTTIDLDRNFFAILVPATPALPVKPEHGTNHHAAGVVAMPGSSSNVPRPPHQGLFGAFMGGV
ncbi:hypothetical protein C8Q72DRAFT_796256 [Fomitopsis betulina]|nr:hypothetical protein C8Q72DRAFT_796256 [Fomitopsis betulina]